MRPRRLAHHTRRATAILAVLACALLISAAPAAALVAYDHSTRTTNLNDKPITVQPLARSNGGAGALGVAAIAVGAIAALIGAGYLGARMASDRGHHPAT